MKMPVPGLPIFLGRARRRRRGKSAILPMDPADEQFLARQREQRQARRIERLLQEARER